jgi:hypothetical protein
MYAVRTESLHGLVLSCWQVWSPRTVLISALWTMYVALLVLNTRGN